MMNIESAKKYIESVCSMVADDHNVDLNMTWNSEINNPERSQPEIVYTLVVKATNRKTNTKEIHFHENQLLHCKSEHETLRVSHHMLNLCNEQSI
jgi:hypothetical protein